MPRLHDPSVRDSIRSRIKALSPGAHPKWGKMSVDQMLWHCNSALEVALGKTPYAPAKGPPLPKFVMRWAVLNGPWPKGRTPTLPQLEARASYDFEAERSRCLALIDEFCGRPVNGAWPTHPLLGDVSGDFYSQLHGRHFSHHLEQFGA